MYAKIENGVVVKFPYTYADLKADNPGVSFPASMSVERMAEYGMVLVVVKGKPEHNPLTQVIEEVTPTFNTTKNQWEQVFVVRSASLGEQQQATNALIASFDRGLTQHLDAVAQSRKYDNRITCALRAGYAGPFQAEGQAFAAWMDQCNAFAYQHLLEVQAGTQPIPESVEAFVATLPAIVWP